MSKKIIIFIILILIIISVILVLIINTMKEDRVSPEVLGYNPEQGDTLSDYYGKMENEGINISAYYDIKKCIEIYLNSINIKSDNYYRINSQGEYGYVVEEDEIKNNIYSLLSSNYISKNSVTKSNVFDKINVTEKNLVYVPIEATAIKDDVVTSFLVHGMLIDEADYSFYNEAYYIVNVDSMENLFSIEPVYGNYTSISDVKIENIDVTLEENNYNVFDPIIVTNGDVAREYINVYKRLAIANPERMYNLLDKEYREKRFGSLDSFKKYVNDNLEYIKSLAAEKYLVNRYDEYTEHVVEDQYGIMHVFDEKAILNYTVKLDTYTIDSEKDKSDYMKLTNAGKVQTNIDTFFQMLNSRDYSAAYNVLSDGFKNTYFQTEDSFEQFIKQYLYDNCEIEFGNYSDKISGVYTQYVEIKNKNNSNDKKVRMNIVMQLDEGTGYKLSFEVIK